MSNLYTDPIIERYLEIIKEAMPGVFKGFYQGDPIRIPASNMPAIAISKQRTTIQKETNTEDRHEITFLITVVSDMRKEMNDDQWVIAGTANLYDIIEGRDANYKLKEQTILNVLRSNININQAVTIHTDLFGETTADYGVTLGKREGETAYALEGQVTFNASFIQLRD